MPTRMNVADLMSTDLVTLTEDETLDHAQRCMARGRIRHLPVVSGGRLVGVVTDRDVAALENDPNASALASGSSVREVCSLDHYSVGPDAALHDVLEVMAERRIGSAIVTEADRIVGLFTATDACRVLAEHLRAPRA